MIVPVVGAVGILLLAGLASSMFTGSQSKETVPEGVSKTTTTKLPVENPSASDTTVARTNHDVSIPYDAAARLAYKEMIREQIKTPRFFFSDIVIDESKFAEYKSTYEETAVKLVIQKKQSRDRELAVK